VESRDEQSVEREAEAAAEEAGDIGGRGEPDDVDPAERPVAEAGGGEAEGFEQSEEMLRDFAEHREPGGNPKYDRGDPEADESAAAYGEADHEHSSEVEGEPER
jgi:hypothetical protein